MWTETRTNAGPDAERVKAFPPSGWRLPATPSGPAGLSYCSGSGREQAGRPARLRQALLQWPGRQACRAHPSRLCSKPPGPSAGWLTRLSSPSCHLPLQSISGSCMWVTQQHCSEAQEAAAEPKGSRRSSERCTLLSRGAWTALPYVLREIPGFSAKSGFS